MRTLIWNIGHERKLVGLQTMMYVLVTATDSVCYRCFFVLILHTLEETIDSAPWFRQYGDHTKDMHSMSSQ